MLFRREEIFVLHIEAVEYFLSPTWRDSNNIFSMTDVEENVGQMKRCLVASDQQQLSGKIEWSGSIEAWESLGSKL